MEQKLLKIEKIFNKLADIIGYICIFVMFLMIADVFFNVTARYFFKYGNVGLQELEWHFFSIIIMLGMSYALKEDVHVRVDVFYDGLKPKTKAIINMLGVVFFILPLALLVAWLSFDYVVEAYESNEGSADPGGLPYRWIIKAFIPFSFYLLIFFSIGYFIKYLNLYIACKKEERK
ncbi:TRAP transporter small permease subunit [Campylobacter sp. RM15925]|uniref:TRAP transporter small permease subunit n=1 Tax=Campylobacter TaxID=194 RepID=UPI001473AC93|nr:TRAP transporter small permease subunit [Campylobacter sp. RM15925]